MKRMIRRMLALCVVAGVAALTAGAAGPATAANVPSVESVVMSGDDSQQLASCEVFKARDMCCPIWCAGKGKSVWDAAKALSGCAKGYGCDWPNDPTTAGYHCDSACK